jgi:hypothetical protein
MLPDVVTASVDVMLAVGATVVVIVSVVVVIANAVVVGGRVVVVVIAAKQRTIERYVYKTHTNITINARPSTRTRAIVVILWLYSMRYTRATILTRLQFIIAYRVPVDLAYRRPE